MKGSEETALLLSNEQTQELTRALTQLGEAILKQAQAIQLNTSAVRSLIEVIAQDYDEDADSDEPLSQISSR